MSTRARTRSAAASTSKDTVATIAKKEQKVKAQPSKTVQAAQGPNSDHPDKENVKSKSSKMTTKTPSKAPPTKRRSTRSTPAVYCTCRKGDDGTPMVQCGECNIWYHFSCVDLKEEDAEEINVYICPSCNTTSGRRTTMTWEGPEAFEECSSTEPASIPALKKQPTTKRIKRDSPVEPPVSESDIDPSSEDEYVADSPKSKKNAAGKRQTRRLSFSSESDSEASNDGKPRRHRIRKVSGSPAPNMLKRKSHQTHNSPPPPKRKKSDAALPTDDPTRKYCLGKLEELSRDIFFRYPHVRVSSEGGETTIVQKSLDSLTDDEKAVLVDESKHFADELEKCIFEIYSEPEKHGQLSAGSNYKDRFRMLQFNLSKVDRVVIHQRIVAAEITPKEISLMSSTDLANEETKQSIKIAEKEALEHSILVPTTAPRAKITHKGLEDIEDVHGRRSTMLDADRSRREEEERRDRERMARLRAQTQARQRTASVSDVPESPVVAQHLWGGPPQIPLQSMMPSEVLAPSSPTFATESGQMNPTFTTHLSDEPELNLADFINIDEEIPTTVATKTSSPPPPPSQLVTAEAPSPMSETLAPDLPLVSPTGISPFAQKVDHPNSASFDLNALWTAPKKGSPTSPPEQPTATSAPLINENKDIAMDSEGGDADDLDFDMFLEEKDSLASSVEAQQAALDALPHVWTGKINMPLDSTIPQETPVFARQVGGRALEHTSVLWKTLFPSDLLRIDGRVPVNDSGKFLLQMRMNPTKELIAVAFSPASGSAEVGFRILSDFLIAKSRHGLVFPWGNRPKDHHPGRELYIIPLLSSDPLPDYMELLDGLHLPKLRKTNLLIGIWILFKGKLAPPPAPAAPTIPAFLPASQIAQPPLIPNAPTPSFPSAQVTPAPPLPTNIAAEVASLTPEQIQLMIQTLTSNGVIPLIPPAQPQAQPQHPPQQQHQHMPLQRGPPPPPPMMPPRPHSYLTPQPPSWGNHSQEYNGGYHAPPQQGAQPNPPMHGQPRPTPLSWDRPAEFQTASGYDRDDRGGRSWRGGGAVRGRGRGRPNDIPPKPVDSGWPRRPRNDDNGPASPTRRW